MGTTFGCVKTQDDTGTNENMIKQDVECLDTGKQDKLISDIEDRIHQDTGELFSMYEMICVNLMQEQTKWGSQFATNLCEAFCEECERDINGFKEDINVHCISVLSSMAGDDDDQIKEYEGDLRKVIHDFDRRFDAITRRLEGKWYALEAAIVGIV